MEAGEVLKHGGGGGDADEAVVLRTYGAVVHADGVLVFRLEEVALNTSRLASAVTARRHKEVLIVVAPLLEEHGLLVAAGLEVVAHTALFVEHIVEKLAAEIDAPVEERFAVQGKMHDDIVRLRVRLVAAAATDKEASVLVLVVLVRPAVPLEVRRQLHVVIRIVVRHALHVHAVVFRAEKFRAAVFVARRKDKAAVEGIGDFAVGDGHGMQVGGGVVATVVLVDKHLEVGLGIGDMEVLCVDAEAELLMALVGVDVGVPAHRSLDADLRLHDGEACGEENLLRIVFAVYLHGIVARDLELHVLVREQEVVVGVLRHRAYGAGIVVDGQTLKAAHILDGREDGPLPGGIAVDNGVGVARRAVLHGVEVDLYLLIAAKRDVRRGDKLARNLHPKRAYQRAVDIGEVRLTGKARHCRGTKQQE